MGRVLQKKKNRSSLPKVHQKPRSKRVNVRSNLIVAANWVASQTLSQNYARLGLTSKLNAHAGGTEPSPSAATPIRKDPLSITPQAPTIKTLFPSTARIVRHPKTGAITSVIHPSPPPSLSTGAPNPLNDLLNAVDGSEEKADPVDWRAGTLTEGKGEGIVAELEAAARAGGGQKRPRMQSRREEEWIARLVGRWGDDFRGMVRDRRLNPGQQTEGDLRRRVKRWRDGGGRAVADGTAGTARSL